MSTLVVICALFALLVGVIAWRGVTGSTFTALMVNIIQLTTLVIFSLIAIYYRLGASGHGVQWAFSGAWDVVA